ncbi:MAG: hypothetical protein GTN68_02365 [Candidatus Aminicenantes bacterium]|nr:hypothetical protein [Candidatus Aminicenantes bacterium]
MFFLKTKKFLSENNINFQERDISHDKKALEELEKLEAMSTPVITHGDELIVGFDKKKL